MAALELETVVLVQQWPGGHVTGVSIADFDLASFGSEAHVVADFEAFLGEYLADKPASVTARFVLPDTAELITVPVALERADLPARLSRALAVDVPCVILTHGRDRWARIPALGHTVSLGRRGVDTGEVVAAEIARLVAALELGDGGWLALLPGRGQSLVRVKFALERGDDGAARAAARRRKQIEEARRAEDRQLLGEVATELGGRRRRPPPRLVGRDRPLGELRRLLGGAARASVVVVGDAAVGKSALVRTWAAEPGARPVYATSAAQLVAGMSGFGEWQERVDKVMAAAERLDAVVYFENMGELLGEHPERGGLDVIGGIRRWVVDGRVRVVGELTREALDLAQRHQVALFGAMVRIELAPLDIAATRDAVAAHLPRWKLGDGKLPAIDPSLIEPLVELLDRHDPYRAFPGKAIRFIDELRASRAAAAPATDADRVVAIDAVYDAFAARSGIPSFLLRDDRALLRDQVIARFRRRMVGQDEAVARVVDTLCVVKAGLQPRGRPLATFLLVGPTGVGKTELARTLADFLFGSEDRMVRFDMTEYADPYAAERLIRGTDRDHGLLTGRVRAQPFSVVLLDEIEKAHPAVFDLLLGVLGEGRLTDARGRTTFFHDTIILMTSNLGASHGRRRVGLAVGAEAADAVYMDAVRDTFRVELIGRIDRIIPFAPLSPAQVAQVARLAVTRIAERRGFQQSGAALDVSAAALAELAARGHSDTYGVRALRRHLDDALVAPVSHLLASLGADAEGALVWVGTAGEGSCPGQTPGRRLAAADRGRLRFEVYRRAATGSKRALRGVGAIAALRREADELMEMESAVWVREQASLLRAQLATAGRARPPAGLQAEHHRLDSVHTAAAAARDELHAVEDLALSALFSGEEAAALADEADSVMRRFCRDFFYVATAQVKTRNEATLAVFDPDRGPLRRWLGQLCAEAPRRGWELFVHARGRLPDDDPAWPADRVWSAPRGIEFAQREVVEAAGHDAVLIRLRGDRVGLLGGMEDGVHRFRGFVGDRPDAVQHLVIQLIAMKADLTDDDWRLDTMRALPPDRPRPGQAFTRERRAGDSRITVHDKDRSVDVADDEYWARLEEIALCDWLWHVATNTTHELYRGLIERERERLAAAAARTAAEDLA